MSFIKYPGLFSKIHRTLQPLTGQQVLCLNIAKNALQIFQLLLLSFVSCCVAQNAGCGNNIASQMKKRMVKPKYEAKNSLSLNAFGEYVYYMVTPFSYYFTMHRLEWRDRERETILQCNSIFALECTFFTGNSVIGSYIFSKSHGQRYTKLAMHYNDCSMN